MLPISGYAETQVDTVLDRRDKDIMRKACSFMAGIQYKYTVHTRHLTCPSLVHSLSLVAHFSYVSSLHGSHYKTQGVMGNAMNDMKKMPTGI